MGGVFTKTTKGTPTGEGLGPIHRGMPECSPAEGGGGVTGAGSPWSGVGVRAPYSAVACVTNRAVRWAVRTSESLEEWSSGGRAGSSTEKRGAPGRRDAALPPGQQCSWAAGMGSVPEDRRTPRMKMQAWPTSPPKLHPTPLPSGGVLSHVCHRGGQTVPWRCQTIGWLAKGGGENGGMDRSHS